MTGKYGEKRLNVTNTKENVTWPKMGNRSFALPLRRGSVESWVWHCLQYLYRIWLNIKESNEEEKKIFGHPNGAVVGLSAYVAYVCFHDAVHPCPEGTHR